MEFDSEKFERRLSNLKDTQDSITSMSKWCLSKRTAHKQIVKSWLKVLKEVKIEQRLTLFYLANDVIQHSKRKNYEFVDSWATALQRASTLVRDDARVKEKISRIFNIWQQREVYAEDFISDLHGLLAISQVKKPSTSSASTSTSITASPASASPNRLSQSRSDDYEDEFQLSSVVSSIRNCVALEAETDKSLKDAVKTNAPDIEKVRNSLKDRSHVEELEKDVESAGKKYELFMESLSAEIKARKILLTALDQAEKFYRNQRRDVKKVVYAYKNFGDRIKSIHTELGNKSTALPSPMPSPDINAPSPEPDNDLDLNFYSASMNGTFGSFMNNDGQLPFDLNEFYRESPPPMEHNQNQSIQVIQPKDQQQQGQQATAPLNDFYNSLIPPKIETYNPSTAYADLDPYRQQPPPPLPGAAPAPVNYTYNSLVPPPPPPQSNQSMNSSNDDYNWNEWSAEYNLNETPVSPPHFERKGRDEGMVEYVDESLRDLDTSLNDIDHRQLFGADIESKDVDHRNLISLTGSPGESRNQNASRPPTNGNNAKYVPTPLIDVPPPTSYMPHVDQHKSLGMPNFQPPNRNPRPPLLPTPNIPPQRFAHSVSMNSDTSQGLEDMESSEVDMDLSDDDGLDKVHLSGDPFYNMNTHARFPHQMSLNRPPPPIPLTPENDLAHHTKPWLMNKTNPDMQQQQSLDEELTETSVQALLAPPNFMSHQSNRNFPRGGVGNFRGQMRMNLNKSNINAPYNNFKGNRGGAMGRGAFRGNFRGQW